MICRGPGPEAATKAAEELIAQGVGGLISFGFAGGVDEQVAEGTLVLPGEIRQGRYDTAVTNDAWRQAVFKKIRPKLKPLLAPMAAVDEIAVEASDKTEIRYVTGGVAADMESFAVVRAARKAGLPAIAIRAVSDPALQSLPILAVEAVDNDGNLRPWQIIRSILFNPGQIGELRRLAKNTKAASHALMTVCQEISPDFCLPDFRSILIRQLRAPDSSQT